MAHKLWKKNFCAKKRFNARNVWLLLYILLSRLCGLCVGDMSPISATQNPQNQQKREEITTVLGHFLVKFFLAKTRYFEF